MRATKSPSAARCPLPASSLHYFLPGKLYQGFPRGTVAKNPPARARDAGLMPGSGRSPGEGSGNPLQYSCLGNPMDRGAWRATVHGVAKESDMT